MTLPLPRAYFHASLSGAVIPHSINPGPQIECPCCRFLRHGIDFRRTSGGVIFCRYCAEAP